MKMKEKKNPHYPWRGFFLFLGMYLITLAVQYPVTRLQAQSYLEILEDAFAYTPNQFALLALLQPLFLGIIAIYGGFRYAPRVHLHSLTSENLENTKESTKDNKKYTLKESIPFVVLFAFGLALLNLGFDVVFQNGLPEMYQPHFSIPTISQALAHVLYDGIGQEILLRWGVMTTIIYVLSAKGQDLNRWIYIIGIVFTAVLYAFSQYNTAFAAGDFNVLLVLRILLLNGLDGILFGWLYYKFHFEAAAISHALMNVLIIFGNILMVALF